MYAHLAVCREKKRRACHHPKFLTPTSLCARQAETNKDLQVERAAHDETAEKMVQLQQRLEVTLQELANLERFTKRQQTVNAPAGTPPHIERLLKEESYLKSRLLFVQQVHAAKQKNPRRAAALALLPPPASESLTWSVAACRRCVRAQEMAEVRGTKLDGAQDAEDRAIDSALSI